jgi:hypothetical protein
MEVSADIFYSFSAKSDFAGASTDIELLNLTHNLTRIIEVDFGGYIA